VLIISEGAKESFSFCVQCSSGPPRLTPRVSQLRQEERVDMGREAAHERELHCAMQMSQSYEDLTIMSGLTSCKVQCIVVTLNLIGSQTFIYEYKFC
jgi:hypothetical protein